IGLTAIVGIEKRDELGVARADAEVSGSACISPVALDGPYRVTVACGDRRGAIGGPIVDDDDSDCLSVLRKNTVDRVGEVLLSVARWDHDVARDTRAHHGRLMKRFGCSAIRWPSIRGSA